MFVGIRKAEQAEEGHHAVSALRGSADAAATGLRSTSCAWRIHKITQQSVSGTARDSASASDTRQNLSATQVRLVPLPPKVFATLVAFAEGCPSAAKNVSWPRAMRFCSVGVGGI